MPFFLKQSFIYLCLLIWKAKAHRDFSCTGSLSKFLLASMAWPSQQEVLERLGVGGRRWVLRDCGFPAKSLVRDASSLSL